MRRVDIIGPKSLIENLGKEVKNDVRKIKKGKKHSFFFKDKTCFQRRNSSILFMLIVDTLHL